MHSHASPAKVLIIKGYSEAKESTKSTNIFDILIHKTIGVLGCCVDMFASFDCLIDDGGDLHQEIHEALDLAL
jgi:hypothetical protein